MQTNIFDRLSFWSLFLVITLLPIFCLPFTNIPIEIAKGTLIITGLALSIVFWAMSCFSNGSIKLPRSRLLSTFFVFILTLLVSSIYSTSLGLSYFGTIFDVGTFWFMVAAFLLMFMSAVTFRDSKKLSILIVGMVFSSFCILLFQTLFLFFPKVFSLGILFNKTDNLLGAWHSFGFFAGLTSLLSLFIIEFLEVSGFIRFLLTLLLFWSLAMVAVIAAGNFPLLWLLIGIFSLVILVYKASINTSDEDSDVKKTKFPFISFTVVTIAVLFFMSGQYLGDLIATRLGTVNSEVSPSLSATISVTRSVLQKDFLFGLGPNKFSQAWAMYKPLSINNTNFWDIDFNSGSGFIPTLTATTGIFSILSLLLFFFYFFLIGLRSIFSNMKRGMNYTLMAFFVTALYLFVVSFFYPSGVVLIMLAFAMTGVFIGKSLGENEDREISISLLSDHRKSFFGMLFLVFVMIVTVVTGVKYGEKFASVVYFRRSLVATDVKVAEAAISKAVSLYPNDLYLKTYAQVYVLKMNDINKKSTNLTDADKTDFKNYLEQAVSGSLMATNYNSGSYMNFQSLGSVYQALASFGVKGASAQAVGAYERASALNPTNPRLKLAMASASFNDGKKDDAKDYANQALKLKGDYVEALILLAQIYQSEGNTSSALTYARQALALYPDSKDLAQYVNALQNGANPTPPEKITEKPTPKTTNKKTP